MGDERAWYARRKNKDTEWNFPKEFLIIFGAFPMVLWSCV